MRRARSFAALLRASAPCAPPAACPRDAAGALRRFSPSSVSHLNDRDGQFEELLERTLVKPSKEQAAQPLTTRREALALYRAVLRASPLFVWRDHKGVPWRHTLRQSARKEFEAARYLTDGEQITRLIISGRDALEQVLDKFLKQRQRIIEDEERAVREGRPPPSSLPPHERPRE